MANITIPVEGMTCGGCVSSVQRALLRIPGVSAALASLNPAQVEVDYEEARVDPSLLVQGIEDAGYAVPASGRSGAAPMAQGQS